MPDDLFDAPGGDLFNWETHSGRLLLITPKSIELGVETIHGNKDATRADIVVLAEPGTGLTEVVRDTLIFPRAIQGQIRGHVGTGRMTLGRLGQGQAQRGQKPPWQLSDPTDNDKATARAYLAAGGTTGATSAPTPQPTQQHNPLPPF